jgi:hypothetical protein
MEPEQGVSRPFLASLSALRGEKKEKRLVTAKDAKEREEEKLF